MRFAHRAAARACTSSSGTTRAKVSRSLGSSRSGLASPAGGRRVRSTAVLPGDTWAIPAWLVIGSETRVAPESSSPT